METSHNTTKLAQHNGNKLQHKEISTTQQNRYNTTKLAHGGNKPQQQIWFFFSQEYLKELHLFEK